MSSVKSVFLALSVFCVAGSVLAEPLVRAKLALNWKPEPEFGGFYQALWDGTYKKEGIDLEIVPGGSGQPVPQMIESGTVDFGIVAQDEVLVSRERGANLVAIWTVYQNNPQGFMAAEKHGFKSLGDLLKSSLKIAIQKGMPYALYLQKKYAIKESRWIPYLGGISQISGISGDTQAQQCFVTSEPEIARASGIRVNSFLISESGYNPYLALVAVRKDFLEKKRDLVQRFVRATRKGWQAYLSDPKTANQAMAKINTSLSTERFQVIAKNQEIFVRPDRKAKIGEMAASRWDQLQAQLQDVGVLRTAKPSSELFINFD